MNKKPPLYARNTQLNDESGTLRINVEKEETINENDNEISKLIAEENRDENETPNTDGNENKTSNIKTKGGKDEEELEKLDLDHKTLGRAFKIFE